MKNIKLSLLIFLLIQTVSYAGEVKLSKDFRVTVGAPYKVVDANTKFYFSDDKGSTISVKTAGEKVTIQKYDVATMKQISSNDYEDFPQYNKVQNVIKLGDKLFYIFSAFNKKEKTEGIYSREVNMAKGTFEKEKLLFSTSKEVTVSSYLETAGVSMMGLGAPKRFEVHQSFDNSKITYSLSIEAFGKIRC